MDWLLENWVWVLIGIAFVALHLFGHGHGGHGGHRQHDGRGAGTKGGSTWFVELKTKGGRLSDERRDDHAPGSRDR